MTNAVSDIWREVLQVLKKSLGQVFTIHLAYAALGFILFAPLVGFIGRLLLLFSGQEVVSDLDIAYFLLSPLGMAALILFSAILITIIVFELASMLAVSAGTKHGLYIGTRQALGFTARRAMLIFMFSIRLVARVLIIILPFLAASGIVAWLLITDYDINFYLTEKPPAFLAAVIIIGLMIFAMSFILVRKLLSWSFTLPLILFAEISPARSFGESEKLTQGQKRLLLKVLGTWACATILVSMIVLTGMQFLGSQLAPLFYDSLDLLVFVLGGLIALWSLANLLVTTFASGSFACLLMNMYERNREDIPTNELVDTQQGWLWQITTPRLAMILGGGIAVAILVGSWLLDGIQAHDNVLIIAHRGAAGKAPENTLAAIRQAMDDGADWIEIDVQESADGEVVVIHDSDFMKLAGVDLKVWNASLEQLQEVDVGSWFGPEFSDERVPTLAEVLEEVRGRSRVVIELKYYGHDQKLEQRVVEIVEHADMTQDTVIMSLKYDGIRKIRQLRPNWIIGLLAAKALGNLSQLDTNFLAVNMGMATPGFIRKAHVNGKQVFVWTVNDRVSMSRMMSLGVDGIITDEPELGKHVLAERSDLSSIERLLIHTAVVLGQPVPERTYRDQSP